MVNYYIRFLKKFNYFKKYEKQILEAYLNIPPCKLLNHNFELEEDYLAGYVTRLIHENRFKEEFVPFLDYELEVINLLTESNKDNDAGKELMTSVLLTKAICNIMNKYKK